MKAITASFTRANIQLFIQLIGPGVRVILGLYMIAIGSGFFATQWLQTTKTTSYLIQARYALCGCMAYG